MADLLNLQIAENLYYAYISGTKHNFQVLLKRKAQQLTIRPYLE